MSLNVLLSLSASVLCGALAVFALLENSRSFVHRIFALGMVVLVVEAALITVSAQTASPLEAVYWQRLRFVVAALLPGLWLIFSLTFARANYRDFLSQWRWVNIAGFVFPLVLAALFTQDFVKVPLNSELSASVATLGWAGYLFHLCVLSCAVVIMINLEKTFRAAAGTKRWQIKFMVLGLGSLLAIQVYISSQALLFSVLNVDMDAIYCGGVIVAGGLMMFSFSRARLLELDIYLSQRFLYGSISSLVVGLYLLAVGLIAKVVNYVGGSTTVLLTDFLIFIALVGLMVILVAHEFRRRVKSFIVRNLKRPQYDYRNQWMTFTERTTCLTDTKHLCATVANLVAETLGAPAVTVWLVGETATQVVLGGSTALSNGQTDNLGRLEKGTCALIRTMSGRALPVDFGVSAAEAGEIQRDHPNYFRDAQVRYCVPLAAGQEMLGVITVSDRPAKQSFSAQDLDLLKVFADQAAAALLNRKLSEKLMQAKEMEAFQALSAFFVHDLKNMASTFSVMIGNLRTYFDDPAFRSDALRTMSQSVGKIEAMCARLALLSKKPTVRLLETNLNELVASTLEGLNGSLNASVINALRPVPRVVIDPEQTRKVLLNLLLNANEAAGESGEIRVTTEEQNGWVKVSVMDNGCGMSKDFMTGCLFRPFQSSKKQGLGIGLFLSKKVVEAQRGRIEVESEEGKGSTFRILLPVAGYEVARAQVRVAAHRVAENWGQIAETTAKIVEPQRTQRSKSKIPLRDMLSTYISPTEVLLSFMDRISGTRFFARYSPRTSTIKRLNP